MAQAQPHGDFLLAQELTLPDNALNQESAVNEAAIDDEDEPDLDYVQLQTTLSIRRRETRDEAPISGRLPSPFLPNIRPLTISDLDSVMALENSAFIDPEHRGSREKFEYRLTVCPELCLGLFCTIAPEAARQANFDLETLPYARPVETGRADKAVSVLFAHIIATKCCTQVITDADMAFPLDWRTTLGRPSDVGHQEAGRTVAMHSLCVAPKLQRGGLGRMIVKAYAQNMKASGLVDRIALICQDNLIEYYKQFLFEYKGESKATFGGGGWHDLVLNIKKQKNPDIIHESLMDVCED